MNREAPTAPRRRKAPVVDREAATVRRGAPARPAAEQEDEAGPDRLGPPSPSPADGDAPSWRSPRGRSVRTGIAALGITLLAGALWVGLRSDEDSAGAAGGVSTGAGGHLDDADTQTHPKVADGPEEPRHPGSRSPAAPARRSRSAGSSARAPRPVTPRSASPARRAAAPSCPAGRALVGAGLRLCYASTLRPGLVQWSSGPQAAVTHTLSGAGVLVTIRRYLARSDPAAVRRQLQQEVAAATARVGLRWQSATLVLGQLRLTGQWTQLWRQGRLVRHEVYTARIRGQVTSLQLLSRGGLAPGASPPPRAADLVSAPVP